ncbi:YybH family protein [Niveibacterium terrae]|uniref:YybH family protein n=1 Tax=Niveibacterium terrae TaxID=3373598 RepID=UPI003A8FEB90
MGITRFESDDQQQVWETLRALNDAWTCGNPDDLADYFHPNMVAITPVARERLEGAAACIAGWKGFAEAAEIHRWREKDVKIQIYGDAAVASYEFEIAFAMGGKEVELGGRDLFFFVRKNGRWWAVADQYSPYPG